MFVHPQSGGQAQLTVFVLGMAFSVCLEQAGAGPVGAGIELDAEQANGVESETYATLRVAGLPVYPYALGPLVGLALCCAGLAEIAIEIEVTQFQSGLAVFQKAGAGGNGQQAAKSDQG